MNLSNCPFCGGWPTHKIYKQARLHYIECCGCRARTGHHSEQIFAERNWNAREHVKVKYKNSLSAHHY